MVKKMLALLLALSVMVCFAACAADSEDEQKIETEAAVQTDPATEPSEEVTQPTTPAVTTPDKKVDLTKLRYIESQDNFAVKVQKTEVSEGHFTIADGVSMDGYDAVLVTIQNDSGKTITGFSVFVLTTDANGQDVTFAGLSPIVLPSADQVYSEHVVEMGTDSTQIASGESETYTIRCTASRFENVNMIVYSYTDANGNEVINEKAYEWLANTMPV